MIKKASSSLDFLSREKEVIAFWRKNDIFKKSVKEHEGGGDLHLFRRPADR